MSDKKKHPGGRPTRYRKEYANQVKELCLLGYTDKKLAAFFDISESTLNLWKLRHKEFSESLKLGKDFADVHVVSALYGRALGMKVTEEKLTSDGSIIELKKELPPDPTSMIFWLKNRQPELWRDKQDMELTGKDGGPILTKQERSERMKELLEKRDGSK